MKMLPEKGKILISEPFIRDPAFGRSVILLVEKNNMGAVGFVLNYKLNISVSDVLESMPFKTDLYQGGPVAHDTIHFLFRGAKPLKNSILVMNGLYWGGDIEELIEKVKSGEILQDNLRFFIGYSGWEFGQLELEMDDNTWIVGPADIKSVFELSTEKLWKQSMKALGGEYALLANSPLDPMLN